MKKFSKKLVLVTSFAFVGLSSVLTSTVVVSNNNAKQKEKTEYIESVKDGLNNFFSEFRNNDKKTNSNIEDIKQSKIVENSYSKNIVADLNLSENVISLMENASNNFVENYLDNVKSSETSNEALNLYLKDNNIDVSNYKNVLFFNSENQTQSFFENQSFSIVNKSYNGQKTVLQVAEEFIKAGKDSAIVGGVAAGAAVGFWAAAPWTFGATIPWAVAAVAASTAYFAQGAIFGISGEVLKSNPSWILAQTMDTLKRTYNIYGTYNLIVKVRQAVTAARILRGVQMATVWAVPVVNIVAYALEKILNNYANY